MAKTAWGFIDNLGYFTEVDGATCTSDVERFIAKKASEYSKPGELPDYLSGTLLVVSVKNTIRVALKVSYEVEVKRSETVEEVAND